MRLGQHQVFAFTGPGALGNAAGVVLLERWLPDRALQFVAFQNGWSETAFLVARGEMWELRWFTPAIEVELCGHATLAAGSVLLAADAKLRRATFHTQSGELCVSRRADALALDLPSVAPRASLADLARFEAALGARPTTVLEGQYALAVFDDEARLRALRPNFQAVAELHPVGVSVTAPGREVDFVSRFFAPRAGIDEDPVTGSAHCTLAPYWAERLGRTSLSARQVSRRGGLLGCEVSSERVVLLGKCTHWFSGEVELGDEWTT